MVNISYYIIRQQLLESSFFNYLGEEFLKPSALYASKVLPLIWSGHVKAVAHIGDGGIVKNITKILPDNLVAKLDAKSWNISSFYGWLLAKCKNLSVNVIKNKFNCDIGLVLIMSKGDFSWKNINEAVEIGKNCEFYLHKFNLYSE